MNELIERDGDAAGGRRRRFANMPLPLRLFLQSVILPTMIAILYYGVIASDIYISEAKYAIRVNSETPSVDFFNSMASLGGMDSPSDDSLIIIDYILSADMLSELEKRLNLRRHYSAGEVDIISRMDDDASMEDFLEYYREKIHVEVDPVASIITVRTFAFEPGVSQRIANTVIELSEKLVNRLSDRIVDDSLRFARSELDNAEKLVRNANAALTRFRSESLSIDPGEETSAVLSIVTGLEMELARARSQLSETGSFMRSDSPQIIQLKGKVDALTRQVNEERKRLTSGEDKGVDYTRLIDEFTPLVLEQELSKLRYTSALASMEAARIEAQSRQRYLISFVQPNLPDEATEPQRLRSVLGIFFGLCIIYGISGLVWAAIKDHMRI